MCSVFLLILRLHRLLDSTKIGCVSRLILLVVSHQRCKLVSFWRSTRWPSGTPRWWSWYLAERRCKWVWGCFIATFWLLITVRLVNFLLFGALSFRSNTSTYWCSQLHWPCSSWQHSRRSHHTDWSWWSSRELSDYRFTLWLCFRLFNFLSQISCSWLYYFGLLLLL